VLELIAGRNTEDGFPLVQEPFTPSVPKGICQERYDIARMLPKKIS